MLQFPPVFAEFYPFLLIASVPFALTGGIALGWIRGREPGPSDLSRRWSAGEILLLFALYFFAPLLYPWPVVPEDVRTQLLVQLLVFSVLLLAMFALSLFSPSRIREKMGWVPIGWKRLAGWGIGGGILALVLAFAAAAVLKFQFGVEVTDKDHPLVRFLREESGPSAWALASLTALVGAPVVEESLFRGALQKFMTRRAGPFYGIAAASVVFALFHVNGPERLPVIPVIAVIGAVLGWIYYRTGSLFASMAAHAVNNLFALIQTAWTLHEP